MPDPQQKRKCPGCEATVENDDDECCSECGRELVPPALPRGKKNCVNVDCPKILPVKAKFCGKCRTPQEPERKKKTCCGEELSDDDEICCMCGKPWSKESDANKASVEDDYEKKRHAATGKPSSDKAAAVTNDENGGTAGLPSDEMVKSQSQKCLEKSDVHSDTHGQAKETLAVVATGSDYSHQNVAPQNIHGQPAVSTQPTLDSDVGHQQMQGSTASSTPLSNLPDQPTQPSQLDPTANLQESPDDMLKHSEVLQKPGSQQEINNGSVDLNQNIEVPPKPSAFIQEKLPPSEVSPTLSDIQQAFSKVTLEGGGDSKNVIGSLNSGNEQTSEILNRDNKAATGVADEENSNTGSGIPHEVDLTDVKQEIPTKTIEVSNTNVDQSSEHENAYDTMKDYGEQRGQSMETDSEYGDAPESQRCSGFTQRFGINEVSSGTEMPRKGEGDAEVEVPGQEDGKSPSVPLKKGNSEQVPKENGSNESDQHPDREKKLSRPRSDSVENEHASSSTKVPRKNNSADVPTVSESGLEESGGENEESTSPVEAGKKRKSGQRFSDDDGSAETEKKTKLQRSKSDSLGNEHNSSGSKVPRIKTVNVRTVSESAVEESGVGDDETLIRKKRKSGQNAAEDGASARTGHLDVQPENEKKKEIKQSSSDPDLASVEKQSNRSKPYNLRPRTMSGRAAPEDGQDVPSTNVQIDASPESNKNRSANLQQNTQPTGGEETDKMKELKKDLPKGYYYQKNPVGGEQTSQKKTKKSNDSKMLADLISVTFKVVIGPEFNYDPSMHDVGIVGPEFNGWKEPSRHFLQMERKVQGDYYLMAATISLDKQMLTRTGMEYKYVVRSKYSDKWDWEEIMKDVGSYNIQNRKIRLQHGYKKETFDVFDIIIFPNHKTFLQKVHSLFFSWGSYWHHGSYDKLRRGRFVGTTAMLPEWPSDSQGLHGGSRILATDFIDHFDELLKQMKVLILDDKFHNTDWTLISQYVTIFLRKGMKILAGIEPGADAKEHETRFFIAVVAVHILRTTAIEIRESDVKLICNGLLLQTREEVPDVDEYGHAIRQHLEGCDKHIKECLIWFVKYVMKMKLYDWLYLMPLLHILGDHCKPYESKSWRRDHTERYGSWWGIAEINKDLDTFKCEICIAIPLEELMKKLQGLFQLDYLLPRTILATLKMSELELLVSNNAFDPEDCLALMHYHVKTACDYPQLKDVILRIFEYVECQLAERKSKWDHATLSEKEVLVEEIHLCCFICSDILEHTKHYKFKEGCHRIDFINAFAQTSSSSISLLWHFLSDLRLDSEWKVRGRDFEQDASNLLLKFQDCLFNWLKLTQPMCMLGGYPTRELNDKSELMAWSCLVGLSWPDERFQESYIFQLKQHFESRITKLSDQDVIALYANEDYSKLHPFVEQLVSSAAFKAVEKTCASGTFFSNWTQGSLGRVKVMLEKVFLNAWPRDSQHVEKKLKHVLQWPSMVNYIKLFFDKNRVLLNENCLLKMQDCISMLEEFFDMTMKGTILVDYLRRIIDNKKNFLDVCGLIVSFKPQFAKLDGVVPGMAPLDVLKTTLELRIEELDKFSEVRSQVNILLTMCKEINPVDTMHLEQKESVIGSRMFLKDICRPRIPRPNEPNAPVEIIYFELPADVYAMLKSVPKYHKYQLFSLHWKKAAGYFRQGNKEKILNMEDILKHVWAPSCDGCIRICKRIQDGSIILERVASLLKAINVQALNEEIGSICSLNNIGGDLSWISLRFKQFSQYEKMQSSKEAAETIMQIAQEYQLQGDFSLVEKLLKSVQNPQEPLRTIEEKMVIAGRKLENVDESKLKCMRSFIKAHEMIQWLRENLKGTQEVKVLVDLAMIRATGQGDVEVNRVSCLHLAVTGFAPLIYDLEESAGFEDLMDSLEEVWRVLQNDHSLPSRLDEVSAHLQWLQDVHKAHGDVEMNALELAGTINDRGVFQVGRLRQDSDGKLRLEDVVSLVLKAEDKIERRTLDLKELHDLQSKLMLIAGKAEKGKDEVDRFSQIFDGIIKLASTYVKLCEAGSILFKDWKARFTCNKDSKYCVQMDFELVERKLIGRPTMGLDVMKHLDDICTFMENCLSDWVEYIKLQRDHYGELNYFTMTQLVKLRSSLAKLKDGTLDPEVFHILHIVKENCTEKDLRQAMSSAWDELKVQGKPVQPQGPEGEDNDVLSQESQFIQELTEEGFSEKLAAKAMKKFGIDNFDDALAWCSAVQMGDEEEEEEDEKMDIQSDKTWAWVQQNLLEELQKSDSQNACSLKPTLEKVWKRFLLSSTQSVSDYLSVEHLGRMLKHLRLLDEQDMNRTAPKHLVKGKPNLVVCPARDILNVVLSIYYQDENKALPQRDEVLFCTENTTHEEVDLLWRRALSDKKGRIFCIMFVDQLTYDVSEMAVKGLEKLMKDSNDYYLVIMCASEDETKSQLVTAFENCRIGVPNVLPDQVCRYLKKKFTLVEDQAAVSVDLERSTVRLVRSERPGMGKSLFVERLAEKLPAQREPALVTLPLHQRKIDVKKVLAMLLKHVAKPGSTQRRIFHFDIAYEVLEGVDYLLFNLLVLGSVSDQDGNVWQRSTLDLYVIETLPRLTLTTQAEQGPLLKHVVLRYLPSLLCRSPVESMVVHKEMSANPAHKPNLESWSNLDQLMDEKTFRSEPYQRVSQYLRRLDQRQSLNDVKPSEPEGTKVECLEVLLGRFGVKNPTWAELHHFVAFLDRQLRDFERSVFCSDMFAQDLPGFNAFVLEFMLQMSNDFATRSLVVTEETPGARIQRAEDLDQYQLRRKWEENPHPFLFFNDDTVTMTFLGFNIERASGNVIDPQKGTVIKEKIMTAQLFDALLRNRVNLIEKFDSLPRDLKIEKLCKVIGVPDTEIYDPDDTYQLTTDNVKKILAIQMRFRCGIPVVLMGETGCGKTRLIQFMCDLQVPPGSEIKNLIKVKTHGGTTEDDIRKKVEDACLTANANMQQIRDLRGPDAYIQTVLFFDEANTTEAIGLIKEIMVDKRMDGRPLNLCNGLKIVAACNPYRRHAPEMVKKLEQAGLGYYVKADETKEKLGEIPMRQLVYRVQALPQSLLPLVWDFGQLNTDTEQLYIKQIVIRFLREENFEQNEDLCEVISEILAASQEYIRQNKDECIFVSLRDVERVMRVMMWFYEFRNILFMKMDDKLRQEKDTVHYTGGNADTEVGSDDEARSDMDSQEDDDGIDPIVRSLILALGVCYIASLEHRKKYYKFIREHFRGPCKLETGSNTIQEQIEACQNVFVEEVQVADNIARNLALKENLFMMVVCVELRIPLFLVGKPGSSKSLAKTIVDNALEGRAAKSELFRNFKQAHMISCQCSRLSTADVIVGTFQQCAKLQENKKEHLKEFVSVVILDEVGLAEDSPHMPLKTLHPLLEDGCIGDEIPEQFKKVAFIGISNWALDPAKTNRGILLQRGVPSKDELYNTAVSISNSNPRTKNILARLIEPLKQAYWVVYDTGLKHGSEFFGLRDFYSLIKMLVQICEKSKHNELSWRKVMHAVWRNFDGLENLGDKDQKNPIRIFEQHLEDHINKNLTFEDDPQSSSLVSDGLSSDGRYLLILTEKDTPLDLLHQQLPHAENAIVIYGSSFPRDQEYTQVCRNINSIKMCMEAGRTVILHNLENLYESLYDALNQYYIIMGPNRFVDLGLGTQRVKCIVHKDFRLVVVAEKETVYKKFSIPLINRLEKHFMHVSSILTRHQKDIVDNLQSWAVELARASQKSSPADLLVGYHVDAVATVVLQITKDLGPNVISTITPDIRDCIEQETKEILLESADPEALMRLPVELQRFKEVVEIYFTKQSHESLADYLHRHLVFDEPMEAKFCQITTYGKLLSSLEKDKVAQKLGWESIAVYVQSLQAFNTEQQFSKMLRNLFMLKKPWDRVLILQCDSGNEHNQLLACARHHIMNTFKQCQEELQENKEEKIGNTHVALVVQLPRQKGGCFISFQGGKWLSAHVDDLRPSPHQILVQQLKKKSVRELVEDAVKQDPKCRQYLTRMTNQVDTRMTESVPKVKRSAAKLREMQEEDFADMPPLEEPDEDIKVYRPERERDISSMEDDASDDAMEETSADDSGMKVDDANIDTDDTQMETDEVSEEHVAQDGGELNLQQLLFSCCGKAATMLRDINHQHTLERIHTIKGHFPEPGFVTEYSDFAAIVQMRLLGLLNEKESRAGSLDQARKWLNGALQNISEIGTFRRTWMSHIEKQLAPLLAGLLKYADTNNNMAILEKTPPGHWLHRLWLKMFSSPAATILEYKDLVSVNSEKLPDEFMVRMTGYGGVEMSGSLPFSWVIKDILDDLLEQARKARDGPESNLDNTFHKTEIGMILKQAYEEIGMEKVVGLYLNDYVHMVYRVVTSDEKKEYSLVKDMIITTCKNEKDGGEEMKLTDIHTAFGKISNRIQNISQLLNVFPEGICKVEKVMQENEEHPLVKTTEMTQDMLCVEACIHQLKPDSKEVGADPEMRQAWLMKVELMMPVLGRIIEQLRQSHEEFGPDCRTYHHKLRCERDKVKAAYLFYKHVQSPQIRDDPMMKAKIPVWSFLRGESDFHKKETMEQVKKIMKLCNDQASKIYLKIKESCGVCKDAMKEPVQLPCEHIFCKPCLDDMNEFDDPKVCPTCKKKLPKNFKIVVIPEKKEAIEAHNRYKQRCNTFFIELIAQLVFVGHEPVDEEVVEMLLSCVTRESKLREAEEQADERVARRTKKLTVLDDCIDPTPVVRSLLLQLLLRARIDRVEEYMDRYFNQAKRFLGNDEEQLLQLCLLFVHSFQDTFYHRVTQIVPGSVNEMERVRGYFEEAEDELDNPGLSMASIGAVGKLRFCLDKLSGYLYRSFILKKDTSRDRLRNLLKSAENVCSHERTDYARWYLLRQLVRQSGLDYVVEMLKNHRDLVWILPPAISAKDFNQPHVLSIYGDPFEKLKVGIRQACRANDDRTLVNTYKNLPKKNRKSLLMVALYVDVTLSVADNILDDQNVQNSTLMKCLAKCDTDPNSDMVKGLLGNKLGNYGKQLTIHPQRDITEQSLAALITHFIIVFTNVPENSLTNPFKVIIETPRNMQGVLLPTMPQDDLVEIFETMAKELKGGWDSHGNFGVYRCQNQHIFMVNNCGHLTDHNSLCPTCKAPIGGQSYNKPQPGVTNVKKDEIRDTTETGHCLGPADLRTKNPYPERKLNRITMSVIRFFVHLAMYAGANHNPQDVDGMIKRQTGSVNTFLWDHLVFDLDILCRCINKSRDDVFQLMHILLKSIASTDGIRAHFSLKDKSSREKWEETFASTYLNPVLNSYNDELQQATAILSGENKYLKRLYEQEGEDGDPVVDEDEASDEVEEEDEDVDVSKKLNFKDVFKLDSLWRYKTRICLEDVLSKLDEYRSQRKEQKEQAKKKKRNNAEPEKADPDNCDVLNNFLDKHDQLSAIRYLPNITRLVRGLVRENHRVLYYHEANRLTLDRYLKNVGDRIQRETYNSYIDDFAAAWEIVRPFLPSYVFGGWSVPKEYTSEPIRKEKTVIATLLPATEGLGLCAVGLIHYLAGLQNDFLRTLPGVNVEEGVVSMEEVFPSNLIYFHPEKDLLPIFLAHCDYSLEVGKTLQIAYNFPALQRHLEERLLRGIPLIEIKVEQVLFREDLTNATKLTNLNDIVHQEYLAGSVVRQIQDELRHLSDITECLLNLDIALGFLMSFRNQPKDLMLIRFLSETLGLNTSYFPPKAQQACELRHVKALWLLLNHESAKVLSKTAQDPFERVRNTYTEELTDIEKTYLDGLLPHLNTDLFLAELHECILMQITKPEERSGDEQVPNWKHRLDDVLVEYISQKDEPPEISVISQRRLGDTILASKCVSVWKYIFHKSIKM